MKYPNIIDGAWASSAPVLWFDQQVPIGSYSHKVTEVFTYFGCDTDILSNAFQAIKDISLSPGGFKKLSKIFNVNPKTPLRKPADVDALISVVGENINTMTMTNYPYSSNFLAHLPAWPVRVACDFVKELPKEPEVEELAAVLFNISQILTPTGDTCLNADICSGQERDSPKFANLWFFMVRF